MIHEETMLRVEDIAVGVQFAPTQPRRAIFQPLAMAPRKQFKQ